MVDFPFNGTSPAKVGSDIETPTVAPPPTNRTTFDQVDQALSQVPLLTPRLRYWGSVWLIELDKEGDKKGRVIYKSDNLRDYREILDFTLEWVRTNLRDRLSKDLGPIMIESIISAAENAIKGEIHA